MQPTSDGSLDFGEQRRARVGAATRALGESGLSPGQFQA